MTAWPTYQVHTWINGDYHLAGQSNSLAEAVRMADAAASAHSYAEVTDGAVHADTRCYYSTGNLAHYGTSRQA